MAEIKQKITQFLNPLGEEEKEIVYQNMRNDANAKIDFYVLIFLASGIAFYGLLQNSPAVIIGAMLVAPLMSPMMAIGFGIVKGDVSLFKRAALTTLLGALLAVGSAAVTTELLPIDSVTDEILLRANPNILDLFIAVISGFAGAYSLSRKGLSAALPGVAISAALVPPLCVVGFGIGFGNNLIAWNALLLFTTNLAGIVVASIIVFVLLGFRPKTAKNKSLFYGSTSFSIIALLVIAIPLTIYTARSIAANHRLNEVRTILETEISSEVASVTDVVVEQIDDGYIVGMTVYVYDAEIAGNPEAQEAKVNSMREELEAAVEGPVTVRAQVIPASLNVFENPRLTLRDAAPRMLPTGR